MAESDNMKEVRFDIFCPKCKHWDIKDAWNLNIGTYDGEKWSGKDAGEEYIPCCYCLETGMRYGTEQPENWEENED